MKTAQSIIITRTIALILVSIGVVYLYLNKEVIFKWTDPTAELRNVGLVLVAIGGIPFLVLGHVNRRSDLEEKRNDLLYRTDVKQSELLLEQVKDTKTVLSKLLTKDKPIGIEEASKPRFNNANEIASFYLEFGSLETNPTEICSFIEESYDDWTELNRVTATIVNIFRVTNNIQNKELKNVVSAQLVSYFNEKELQMIFFISMLFDCNNSRLITSNSQFIKKYLKDIEYQGFLSKSFYEQLEKIQKTYFKFGAKNS